MTRRRPSDRPAERHDNPARLYLESLSPGSHWGMNHALETIAEFLSDGEHTAETFAWAEVRFRDAAAVRSFLADRYQPSTVNKMLAAFRGVMKQSWRLGLIDAETYRRTIDIDNLRASTLPRGRALEGEELSALFQNCAEDPSPAGRRDAAMLAVLYGAGLRRAEVAGLDLGDFTHDACSLRVRNGKRRKERTVYLAEQGCEMVKAWIQDRGNEPGPLFCPVGQTGEVRTTRMRGESITYILQRRQRAAGVEPFSPHDLRRSCLTSMLENGVDVFTVQKLAGHADPSTTARYDRRGEGAKLEAARGLRFS
jgi:site-specific recombinase XerD